MGGEARYIGDPLNNGEGPASVTMWGLTFPKGEWVRVDEAYAWSKCGINRHFETRGAGKAKTVAKPVETPVEEAPAETKGQIPEDWRTLHHFARISLAKSLDADLADGIKTAADADALIEWHLEGKDFG